ncbi:24379_t:CDS:2, partial [Gigaspora rosea]
DLGLEDHHFEIFRKEAINGPALLKLNTDKLMQAGLGMELAENISEFILGIKGEGQAVTTSSWEKELLQKLVELEKQLRKSIH